MTSDTYVRPSWDEYFMEITRIVGKRATCDRGRNGCVITKDNRLLVSWYVWSAPWMPHCDDIGHQFKQVTHENWGVTNHCTRTIHAAQNAICQAAKYGISLEWATIYCKMTPCRACAMSLVASWIKRVVCEKKYHDAADSEQLFASLKIPLMYFDPTIEEY